MSDRKPLMPKATAVWLVDNTSLTFDQIAAFCSLHELEVKGIADGDVAQGIKGLDPIASGQLTREEIKRAEEDSKVRLKLAEPKVVVPPVTTKKGPRYTPVSRRQDRPNAILWLLRNHAELKDAQIVRIVGTTKPTITQIRDRTHWNSQNLQPQDPVTLGLCSQVDLDAEVAKAAKRVAKEQKAAEKAGTLLPTEETTSDATDATSAAPAGGAATSGLIMPEATQEEPKETEAEEDARVFAKLKELSSAPGEAEGSDNDAEPAAPEETAARDDAEAAKPDEGQTPG